MNTKKWKKLKRNPKAFFADSKFNPLHFFKREQLKNAEISTISKSQSKGQATIQAQLKIEDAFEQINKGSKVNLQPIENDFNFDFLIENIKPYNINSVYINPIDSSLKSSLCILQSEKEAFFKQFLSFLYNEGINIAYKFNGGIKKPKSVNEIWKDISNLKQVDIRLSTERIISTQPNSFWFRLELCEDTKDYIFFPTSNHISRKLWKHAAKDKNIFDGSTKNYDTILAFPHEQEITFDIDLVFTWVNSDDKDWQEMYRKYKPFEDSDATSTSRFLSRDELKFALRSWEKYGAFFRKIYIVSNCAPPEWLNLENEQIEWIYHETIMPESVLPTFSSHAIETSLFKIPGLSNYFIYNNDDIVLVRPTTAYNFYYSNGITKLKLENWGNVNGNPKEKEPDYLNAARNSNALLEKEFGKSTSQLHTHSPQAMRVDIFKEMYNKYGAEFDKTMSNKFRTIDDISVTSYFYHHYALLSGRAIQSLEKTELVKHSHDFKKKLTHILELNKKKEYASLPFSVCINDGAGSHLDEEWNAEVINFLNNLFPNPSKFEKSDYI